MEIGTLEYKPLRHVMNYIPNTYRRELDDVQQWESWALQKLRTVNMHDRFIHDLAFIDIVNHKGQLPAGLKKITGISILYKSPTDEELSSLNSCVKYDNYKDALADDDETDCPSCNETTTETTTEETTLPGGATKVTTVEKSFSSSANTCCSLNYQLFLQTPYWENCWKPMRYIGRTHKDYFTRKCYDSIHQEYARNDYTEFSITQDLCLLTEISSGTVCIEYVKEANDGDNFLAPSHPEQLWLAMAHFGMAQYWLRRTTVEPQLAMNMFKENISLSRNSMLEAKGIMKLSGIDMKNHFSIMYNESRILKSPATWSYKIGDKNTKYYYN